MMCLCNIVWWNGFVINSIIFQRPPPLPTSMEQASVPHQHWTCMGDLILWVVRKTMQSRMSDALQFITRSTCPSSWTRDACTLQWSECCLTHGVYTWHKDASQGLASFCFCLYTDVSEASASVRVQRCVWSLCFRPCIQMWVKLLFLSMYTYMSEALAFVCVHRCECAYMFFY